MGSLDFSVSVDDDKIPERLRKGLKSALRDIGDDLLDEGEDAAQKKIQTEGRVWRKELRQSFERDNSLVGGGDRVAVLRNVAPHASPVEYGAVYGARGPPVAALIPWIMDKWHPGDDDAADSHERSRRFSENKKLRLSDDGFNERQIAQEILDGADFEADASGRANSLASGGILNGLKQRAELSAESLESITNDLSEWKGGSGPFDPGPARYAALVREAFGIDGESRGDYNGPFSLDDIRALRAYSEIGREWFKRNYNDGNAEATLYRGLGRETSRLTREMIDNPRADSWTIDTNAIDNYTTHRIATEQFDRGLVYQKETNLDEDAAFFVDFIFFSTYNDENEIHVIGGRNNTFQRSGFEVRNRASHSQRGEYFDVERFLEPLESGDWSGSTPEEMESYLQLFAQMDKYDVFPETPAGQQAVLNYRDEMLNTGRYSAWGPQSEFIEFMDRVIGGPSG